MITSSRLRIGRVIGALLSSGSFTLLSACGDGRIPAEKLPAHGESCREFPCRGDLSCHEGTCMTREERDARVDAANLKAAAASAPPPVGAGSGRLPFSVKVRRSKDKEAFAQCAADERLVGGGCSGYTNSKVHSSSPEGFAENDTLGARWRCLDEFTAFAMCMWVPPAEAPTDRPGAPSSR